MKKISIKSSKGGMINGVIHQNGNDLLMIIVHGFKDNMNIYAVKQLSISLNKFYSVFRFTFPDVEKNKDNFNLIEEFDYLEPLRKLAKLYPTYAVPGNHEYGVSCSRGINDKCDYSGDVNEETKQILTNMGIRYLMNDLEKITINSSSFYLFGGDE